MKRFYITQEEFNNSIISGDEFNHIKNVMRMKEGDCLVAFLASGKEFEVSINQIKKDYLIFNIIKEITNIKNPTIKIDLYQSLAKGEKMELVSQKATEIGVSTIIPLFVKNCDVKPNTNKPARLEKIVIGACKQCGRSEVPTITEVKTLNKCIDEFKNYDLILFANETENNTRLYDTLKKHESAKKIAVIIGPEGGFTPEEINEIKKVSTSVSLGKRILRTETAGIYILSIINDFYRN